MSKRPLRLEQVPGRFAVCRLAPSDVLPDWASADSRLLATCRTDRELSITAQEDLVPASVVAERGFIALRVAGTLDFSLVGVLSRLTGALADAGVPVFVISTYDTDILLVKEADAVAAQAALAPVADVGPLTPLR